MNKQEQALKYFRSGCNCAQSVLAPFHADFGISEEHCLKIACAYGAGMGRQQLTCGAVTGALMSLGLRFGKGLNDDVSKKLNTYSKTKEFFTLFSEKNGSCDCLALLDGLHMEIPEEMKRIEELDLHRIRCEQYVRDAVQIAEKLMSDN